MHWVVNWAENWVECWADWMVVQTVASKVVYSAEH